MPILCVLESITSSDRAECFGAHLRVLEQEEKTLVPMCVS